MAITLEEVRRRIDVDEPDYVLLARELGPDAAPHVRALVENEDDLLASKAAYLASLLPTDTPEILAAAANSKSPEVRIAAAAGLSNTAAADSGPMLERLLADDDVGVRKAALRSAGALRASEVRATVAEIARSDPEDLLRRQASAALSRMDE